MSLNFIKLPRNRKILLDKPKLMGILNVTPDSFWDGTTDVDLAVERAFEMIQEGADIIDIGGQSTRPGAKEIQGSEEIKRIIRVIKKIRDKDMNIPISVDTYLSDVAYAALSEGVDMVNDISGFTFDAKMTDVVSRFESVPCVVMHTTGKSDVMQQRILPDNLLISEILKHLSSAISKGESYGIQTIVDPGIGFGKNPQQNLKIIMNLDKLKSLERPILVGPSRKSFIGYILSDWREPPLPPSERLEGTITACILCIMRGANILRVHDVSKIKRAIKVLQEFMQTPPQDNHS